MLSPLTEKTFRRVKQLSERGHTRFLPLEASRDPSPPPPTCLVGKERGGGGGDLRRSSACTQLSSLPLFISLLFLSGNLSLKKITQVAMPPKNATGVSRAYPLEWSILASFAMLAQALQCSLSTIDSDIVMYFT